MEFSKIAKTVVVAFIWFAIPSTLLASTDEELAKKTPKPDCGVRRVNEKNSKSGEQYCRKPLLQLERPLFGIIWR